MVQRRFPSPFDVDGAPGTQGWQDLTAVAKLTISIILEDGDSILLSHLQQLPAALQR